MTETLSLQCGALESLHQQRKKLKDLKKQLWIVLHFSQLTDEMIHASSLPLSMVALHNTPRYSREIDYMGFLGKKKLPKGPTLYFVMQTLFWLDAQNF